MKKEKKKASEVLSILSQQWANVQDIMDIAAVGKNKATEIKSKIKNNLEKEGYKLPTHLIHMVEVIKYFKIDINYLKKRARDGDCN